MRVGSRGLRTLEVSAGALWKGFCDEKMDRETSAKREIERVSDLALYKVIYILLYEKRLAKLESLKQGIKNLKRHFSDFGQSSVSILYYITISCNIT